MSEDRMELKILGQVVGTCTGWDQLDTIYFTFSDVKFNERFANIFGVEEEAEYLNIEYDKGEVQLGVRPPGEELLSDGELYELRYKLKFSDNNNFYFWFEGSSKIEEASEEDDDADVEAQSDDGTGDEMADRD